MNFLELCQALRSECSVAGVGPAAVERQTGMYQRLVNWTRQANIEIQGMYFNWKFLFRQLSVALPDSEGVPVAQRPPDDLSQWVKSSLELNGRHLPLVEYYQRHLMSPDAVYALLMPDNSLMIFNCKTGDQLTADYYATPQTLTAALEQPWFPSQYHYLIVYRAMMMYANFDNAAEVKGAAMEGWQQLLPRLEASQLPLQEKHFIVAEDPFIVTPE